MTSKGTQSSRLQSLETRSGLHRHPGGVVVVGQPDNPDQWEQMVADATAAAGPGAHLIVPGMALDVDQWEKQAQESARRLAAEDERRKRDRRK
jgi:hypothetical protein